MAAPPPSGVGENEEEQTMRNQLPDNLRQALLAYDSPMALITEVNHETAIVAKMPAADLAGFRGAAVALPLRIGAVRRGPGAMLGDGHPG